LSIKSEASFSYVEKIIFEYSNVKWILNFSLGVVSTLPIDISCLNFSRFQKNFPWVWGQIKN
jgi:hypothetical protein